jgi:hypothetical protein
MVLDSSMADDSSTQEEQEECVRFRQVVGSVVLLFDNLSARQLARALFLSVLDGGILVLDALDSLHAIFDVPEDLSTPIQMLHLSFRNFLVDSADIQVSAFKSISSKYILTCSVIVLVS